jgi:hypothetical protein
MAAPALLRLQGSLVDPVVAEAALGREVFRPETAAPPDVLTGGGDVEIGAVPAGGPVVVPLPTTGAVAAAVASLVSFWGGGGVGVLLDSGPPCCERRPAGACACWWSRG